MVEYITKSDAVFAACKVLDAFGGCHMGPFCPDSGCKEVRNIINNVPAADVVEVVRCRECKHYDCEDGDQKCVKDAEWSEEDMCYYGFISYHGPEFFCADGERKGGGQEPPEEVLSGTKR